METTVKANNVAGARELDVSQIADLFQLETLSPPGESNGASCCVILCWTKTPGEPSVP